MLVHNREKSRLTSNITPVELAKAMSQLDLSAVPEDKVPDAIRDHLMRIMADSIHDKSIAFEIHASRLLRQNK